jgi:hypothetical protein
MYSGNEDEDKAAKELRRIDHLLFVTLKYTRTVDVIRSILQKYLNTIGFRVKDHYEFLFEKGKIKEVPIAPVMRIKRLEVIYPKDEKIKVMVDFFIQLKAVLNDDYRAKEEYRKNVTLVTKEREVNIPILKEYVNDVKAFVEHIDSLEE